MSNNRLLNVVAHHLRFIAFYCFQNEIKYIISAVRRVSETIKKIQTDNVPLLGLPIYLLRKTIANREYNNTNNRTSFTYTKRTL